MIFTKAAGMFREKGYVATSMRDLATSVGLEPSSLYSHIKSKEEILISICMSTAEKFMENMDEVLSSDQSVLEKAEALLRFQIQIALDDPSSVTVFTDEWRNLSSEHLTRFKSLRKSYENGFLGLLEQGINEGILVGTDAQIMLNTMLSAVKWVHFWNHRISRTRKQELENQLIHQIIGGIKNS